MFVRKAENSDIEHIVELWNGMMRHHIERDSVYEMRSGAQELFRDYALACIRDEQKRVFVCCDGNEIAGYAMACIEQLPPVYIDTSIGEVDSICVSGKYRRKGVGKMLVEECEKWFAERGIKRAECMVSLKNPLALAFWEACGYEGYNKKCYKRLGALNEYKNI